VIDTPIIDEKSWPKMTLRGWESGEEIALYSRMALAPKEARMMGMPLVFGFDIVFWFVGLLSGGSTRKRRVTRLMLRKAPMKE